MRYDTYGFDPGKIGKHCAKLKTKDQKIEYLKNVHLDYLDEHRDADHANVYCDVCADIVRPECGANDPFVIWIYNEIKRIEIKKDKYKRLIARLDEINPKTYYPIPTIAILVGRTPRTVKNWITSVSIGDDKKLNLKVTMHAGKPCIKGQDMLNFLRDWNIAKEQ